MAYLGVAGSSIVHETIDGEVVIVNLDKGLYFSTDGVGAQIWSLIVGGHTAQEVRERIAQDHAAADTAADVEGFLADLKAKELVVETDVRPAGGDADPPTPATYATPTLHTYTDMEELLLLDPIHEVDEQAGWPNTPA